MSDVMLSPATKPFRATVAPPGSKSLTNRALILAALADGVSELSNVLFADDTLVMLEGLQQLNFDLEVDENKRRVKVRGQGGTISARSAELFCGNSGTTIRFLSALCALGKGEFTLDGIARMRQRPIRELADLLRSLGTGVQYLGADGFPPVKITADGFPGGLVKYGSAASSQFLSAILMACPFAKQEIQIDLQGEQTSWPYVAMTMQLMDRFGHMAELVRDTSTGKPKTIFVPQGNYSAINYVVEPDASNASYFLAAAAINPEAKVTIERLGKSSLQGDVGFADVLKKMGANVVYENESVTVTGTDILEGIDVNLLDMPDTAQTLAVVAMFAKGETTIRGLHTLKLKETDRLTALSTELQKFGAVVQIENNDTLIITPPTTILPAEVDTYDDHRMAMSFAVAGTRMDGVRIKDSQCVNKTYPEFFADLKKMIGSSES